MSKIETVIVPIRLTPTEIEELDRIMSVGHYASRSGVIRAGLGKMMEIHGTTSKVDAQIVDERKACRPRRATRHPRHFAKDLRKPSTHTPSNGNTNGKAKRKKPGGSKVK